MALQSTSTRLPVDIHPTYLRVQRPTRWGANKHQWEACTTAKRCDCSTQQQESRSEQRYVLSQSRSSPFTLAVSHSITCSVFSCCLPWSLLSTRGTLLLLISFHFWVSLIVFVMLVHHPSLIPLSCCLSPVYPFVNLPLLCSYLLC